MYYLAHAFAWIISIPVFLFWRLAGWKLEGDIESAKKLDKYVAVGAPHTTNWDYIVFLVLSALTRRQYRYFIKQEALKGLLRYFMRWTGAVPIDRSQSHNFVDAAAEAIKNERRIVIALTPEGTRKRTEYWRSGFYYIALKAEVPLILFAVNYSKKRLYASEPFMPTGDAEADMAYIREFYEQNGMGKFPRQAGEVRFRPQA